MDLVEQAAVSGFNQRGLFNELMNEMDSDLSGDISMKEFFEFLISNL